ncbi:S8 family serine peptidase [Halobacteriaceae archaeon GCM10025711]
MKASGAALGGIAFGTTITAATSADRFLVDTKNLDGVGGGLRVVHDLDAIDVAVVEGDEADVEALGASYAADTRYSLDLPVDETPRVSDQSATDEPLYPYQWDKQVQDVPSAHEVTRGERTRVAIIDSGIGAGHPDLQHAVNHDLSRNFTDDDYGAPGPYGGYHGTHVAGIVAANDRNETGTVGTAPGTELVDCRVFSPGALASFADIVAAMVYSAEIDADAANLSIGAYPVERQALGEFYGKVLNRATTYANRRGTLLVVSAGNDGADLQHDGNLVSLPNEAANVMSISATGPIGFMWGDDGLRDAYTSPAFYTNYGTNAIDVSAPGGDADLSAIGTGVGWYYDLVLSTMAEVVETSDGKTTIEYDYGWAAGTSMAAPQVVGAAALVKSVAPDLNANDVRDRLQTTARDVGDKAYHGHGFLDPDAAVRY